MSIRLREDGSSAKKLLFTSILFMGLGHLIYLKQYIKGILYAGIEIGMLWMLPNIITKLSNMITLGTPKPDLPVKLRDHSIFMLIDGVMMVALLFLFVIIYIMIRV